MDLLIKVSEISILNLRVIIVTAILLSLAWHFCFTLRKRFIATSALTLAVFSFLFLGGIESWFVGLGGDSFLETNNFDSQEAYFWVIEFIKLAPEMVIPLGKVSVLIFADTLLLTMLLIVISLRRPIILRGMGVLLVIAVVNSIYVGYSGFSLGKSHVLQLKQQFDSKPHGFMATEDIDLFVYIGESTSSLNMSLYGYPLPTTPQLEKLFHEDIGFVRFDGVRSTHTHTSLSLVRALAITSPQSNGHLEHWGIGGVLNQSGARARLYSVQPLNGSFATFSRFIFDGIDLDLTADNQFNGNYTQPKQKDHELLEKALLKHGVVFFHSYAGHGKYDFFIDLAMSHEVKRPLITFDGIYGTVLSKLIYFDMEKSTKDYDRAMTYIDRNVAHAIEDIKSRRKPGALIYFSDHGDAVYPKRHHDSSKYIDEMTTVPMVIYFNDAYRQKYPEVVASYRQAALSRQTRLLDQIAPTILDVLRVRADVPIDVPTLAAKSNHPHPYILERETVSGLSKIDINYTDNIGFSNSQFFGGTPEPTYISLINEKFGDMNTICYHRSNSYAKALRGAAVANCLEFDLVVDGKELNVYHPPTTATGLQIEHIFNIATARKNNLWIDSKNLDNPVACNTLASFLEANHNRVGKILVEFPDQTVERLPELRSCINRLKAIGILTSYYVPTQFLVPCSKDSKNAVAECLALGEIVQKAMSSGFFSDLSFDYDGYPAMKRIPGAEKFKWNTWTIKAQDFHRFPRQNFGFIIMDTSMDPNTY